MGGKIRVFLLIHSYGPIQFNTLSICFVLFFKRGPKFIYVAAVGQEGTSFSKHSLPPIFPPLIQNNIVF